VRLRYRKSYACFGVFQECVNAGTRRESFRPLITVLEARACKKYAFTKFPQGDRRSDSPNGHRTLWAGHFTRASERCVAIQRSDNIASRSPAHSAGESAGMLLTCCKCLQTGVAFCCCARGSHGRSRAHAHVRLAVDRRTDLAIGIPCPNGESAARYRASLRHGRRGLQLAGRFSSRSGSRASKVFDDGHSAPGETDPRSVAGAARRPQFFWSRYAPEPTRAQPATLHRSRSMRLMQPYGIAGLAGSLRQSIPNARPGRAQPTSETVNEPAGVEPRGPLVTADFPGPVIASGAVHVRLSSPPALPRQPNARPTGVGGQRSAALRSSAYARAARPVRGGLAAHRRCAVRRRSAICSTAAPSHGASC